MDADLTNTKPSMVQFTCPSCGLTRGLQAQYAGRKVKCKCGNVGVVPQLPAKAPKSADDDGEFDLIPLALPGAGTATATAKIPPTANRELVRCEKCRGMFTEDRLHDHRGKVLCGECAQETPRKRRTSKECPKCGVADSRPMTNAEVQSFGDGVFNMWRRPRACNACGQTWEPSLPTWVTVIFLIGAVFLSIFGVINLFSARSFWSGLWALACLSAVVKLTFNLVDALQGHGPVTGPRLRVDHERRSTR